MGRKRTAVIVTMLILAMVFSLVPEALVARAEEETITIDEGTVISQLTWTQKIYDKAYKPKNGTKKIFEDDLGVWTVTTKRRWPRTVTTKAKFKIVKDPNTLSGEELAKDEARVGILKTLIPKRAFYKDWGMGWHFKEVSATRVRAKVALNGAEKIVLYQTTELAPDGHWVTTLTRRGQEVSAKEIRNKIK